jgi:hypothetical protein
MPSALIAALPFALINDRLHVLTQSALHRDDGSSDLGLTKIFWTAHVESIFQELDNVKKFGPATVEEWLKGLEDRGKRSRNDSLRWEKWISNGGLSQMRTRLRVPHLEPGIHDSSVITASRPTNGLLNLSADLSDPKAWLGEASETLRNLPAMFKSEMVWLVA